MTTTERTDTLEAFYADVAANELQPLWTQGPDLMPLEPTPRAVPYLWRWQTLRALAERSGRLIPIDRGGDRRVLSLSNPGLGGRPFASPTLWGAVQYLNPGEHAPGHRHTPGAVRFMLEGDGVYTTVDGDACDMHPGDLVLTPAWNWHDHNSSSTHPVIWFDGLDLPLVNYLDAVFFEPYPVEELQPVQARNASTAAWPAAGLAPAGARERLRGAHSPLLVYRFEETDRALTQMAAATPDEPSVTLEYVSPLDGRPALPTLGCMLTRLRAGRRTTAVRRAGSSVFVVFRGHGRSVVEGEAWNWGPGDMFVAPSWAAVEHEADEPTDLFWITDEPVLRALGLYRETTLDGPQEVRRQH